VKFNQKIQDAICNTVHDCVAPIEGFEEETSDAIITALENAGYTIVPTRILLAWQLP
jgi:hypothetical protein